LRQFGTIAYNAFMEVAQQPVYLLLMAGSCFFCVFLSVVPYFGFGDDIQMVKTSTLAVMLVTGLFGAVLCASSSVAREIRSGTALAVLSKPVGRARFLLGKYAGLSGALALLVFANLVACLLASRMAYDAYGSADTFSFALYCLGGLLAAFVVGGFLNYFLQLRFVITTVIAMVILTTAMSAIIFMSEPATTGASADPRLVDWRLISASVLILFAVLILTALALACSTRLELMPTLAVCSGVLFLGLMSDWLFLGRVDGGSWWASILYTVTPNWQNFWLADVLEGEGAIPTRYIGQAFGYLVGYVGATLSVALWLFEDRELS
jgi:ABC-type transport system involved in multi-copper enzyme maturation permease subunit